MVRQCHQVFWAVTILVGHGQWKQVGAGVAVVFVEEAGIESGCRGRSARQLSPRKFPLARLWIHLHASVSAPPSASMPPSSSCTRSWCGPFCRSRSTPLASPSCHPCLCPFLSCCPCLCRAATGPWDPQFRVLSTSASHEGS